MDEANHSSAIDVLIVGAGMAGLAAAIQLQGAGLRVVVVDKGRSVGGRIATRRIGEATFDHGAQFITAHEPRFAGLLEDLSQRGSLVEWCRGFKKGEEGHPRWRGKPAMTAVPKDLSCGIEIMLERQVTALQFAEGGWSGETATGGSITAKAVILTCPVPQALAILDAGAFNIEPAIRKDLAAIDYERCIVVMAVLEGPSKIPPPGGLAPDDPVVAWVADNQLKGISAQPAVTIHATHEFSLANWDCDRTESARLILAAARQWLGRAVETFQVHGWRYSKPMGERPQPCVIVNESPLLVIAGDAFSAPRVEGAAISGWAAADAILRSQ